MRIAMGYDVPDEGTNHKKMMPSISPENRRSISQEQSSNRQND
jgi:hypothetical protein